MIQRCFCGKEILPPRTTYCSEKCHRQAARKKRSSALRKPAVIAPSKPGKPKENAKTPEGRKSTSSTGKNTVPSSQPTTKKSVVSKPKKQKKALESLSKSAPIVSSAILPISLRKEQPLLMPLGRNMPAKMELLDAIQHAHGLGYTALQFFLSDPDRWPAPQLSPTLLLSAAQALSAAHFSCVVIHAPFVIDLASSKESIWINSVLLLRTVLQQARLLGASDVVVHLNNYKRSFDPVSEQQLERIVKGITYSLSDGPNIPLSSVRLLLENGCKPHSSPGSKIEELGHIFHALRPEYQTQVRICLDTAHCWSAGYDLCNQMDHLSQTIESVIGLAHLQILHLNDAKHKLGSTIDEHAQWGTGQISTAGVHGIQSFLQDSRLAHLALIMETPLHKNEKGQPDWEQERQHLALVKNLLLAPQ